MSWSSIIGQERVKSLLKRTLQSGQIAHAYLFYGPEGIGKDALAIEFAKTLNCTTKGIEACGICSELPTDGFVSTSQYQLRVRTSNREK